MSPVRSSPSLDKPVDARALGALGLFLAHLKDLLEARDLRLGLLEMILEAFF